MNINRYSVFKRIKGYIVPVKGSIIGLIITSMLMIPVRLISPKFFQILIDEVMANRDMYQFYIVVFGLLSIYVLQCVFDGAALFWGNRVLNTFTLGLRKDILQKYQRAPYSFLEKKEMGDLKMRIMDDVNCLGNFVQEQVVDYTFGILMIGFSLFMALKINVKMTLYCLAIIPFVFLINFLIGRGTKKVNEEIRSVNEKYYTSTHNSLQFWREIKTQNAEEVFVERFKNFRKILARLGFKSIRYWAYSEVFNDFKANYLTKVLVYIVGAFFVIRGEISVGILIMFSEYFAMLFSALDSTNAKRISLKVNTPYYKQIFETLDFPEEHDYDKNSVTFSKNIDIKNLCFCYREGNEVLKNINLTIPQGDYVAVIGKTGCGKTTLSKLLLGLYEAQNGEIYFDDQNLCSINKQSLYSQIGVVMQDNFIFNMTIRENLLLSNQKATHEDLVSACIKANIYSFIMSLPDRFDTMVGERGVKLSGGQKQRIAIAAALLKSPELLIFDEATSSLDRESEDVINHSINEIAKGITVIVISHKPASVLRAKRVAVMDNGQIIAAGTHDELIKTNLFYKKLTEAENNE